MSKFVHLHIHSEFSLLDGANRIKDIPVIAKELGMDAIAITDHGAMFGVIDFYKACKANGIKPIIGCEVYVAPRTRHDKDPNIDKANLKEIEIVAGSDVTILKKKADRDKEYKTSVELNTLKLPISKGDTIGKLIVRDTTGNKIDEVAITINNDIKKDNFFNIFLKLLKSMIQGELF